MLEGQTSDMSNRTHDKRRQFDVDKRREEWNDGKLDQTLHRPQTLTRCIAVSIARLDSAQHHTTNRPLYSRPGQGAESQLVSGPPSMTSSPSELSSPSFFSSSSSSPCSSCWRSSRA